MAEVASKRAALKPSTYKRLREFAKGFDGTQDDVIAYLLAFATNGKDEYEAGKSHRVFAEAMPKESDDTPPTEHQATEDLLQEAVA